MENNCMFSEAKAKYLKTLKQYVPIVARVHGKHHPEFFEVQKLFDAISQRIKVSRTEPPALNEEFAKLREITKSYAIPDDVCESYEAVYKMLAELDKAYHT